MPGFLVPDVSSFRYQSTQPTNPVPGEIWIDSDEDVPVVGSTQSTRWKKIAAGGETTLSGLDDNSLTLTYSLGYEQVFVNGTLLSRYGDYTASSGTSVILAQALVAGDIVEIITLYVGAITQDAYTQTQSDAKYALKTGPAFSAWNSSVTSIGAGATVKIGFQTKEFDTNSNFDTTLSRFTPTVSGYYQINVLVTLAVAATGGVFTPILYKNGSEFKWGGTALSSTVNFPRANISTLVFANGTTDYFEVFAGHNQGVAVNTYNLQNQTFFQAVYVRGA